MRDLLNQKLIHEGDNLKLTLKGEVFWARVTGNGLLEIGSKTYSNPSVAASSLVEGRAMNGWYHWHYKTPEGGWERLRVLRDRYEEKLMVAGATKAA